jgi:hypothetical protein
MAKGLALCASDTGVGAASGHAAVAERPSASASISTISSNSPSALIWDNNSCTYLYTTIL